MKITFIQVNMSAALSRDAMAPLAFAVLAGLTPKHHEITFYDERIENIPLDLTCDVAVISVGTYTARRAYQLATQYRNQGIKVILGGYHPTFMPNEALKYADSVLRGDAETLWEQALADMEKGVLKPIYEALIQPDISQVYYDESIFLNKKYSKITPVQFSRGCKYACEFCSINAFYGGTLRYRSIECVIEEIKRKRARFYFIVDDNLFTNRELTKAFLMALIPLGVQWVCQISIDIVEDDELLELMVKSGCICVLIGFETLNQDNLKKMRKSANLAHIHYDTVIQKLQFYGLMVYGTFILGYDHDTVDAFDSCLEFALKSRFVLANFNPLTPMPGTRLYERFKAEGRLLRDPWWLDPDYRYGDATFIPAMMSPKALTEGCYRIRKRFNSYGNILNRYWKSSANRTHTGIYLAANYISRSEINNKQGKLL